MIRKKECLLHIELLRFHSNYKRLSSSFLWVGHPVPILYRRRLRGVQARLVPRRECCLLQDPPSPDTAFLSFKTGIESCAFRGDPSASPGSRQRGFPLNHCPASCLQPLLCCCWPVFGGGEGGRVVTLMVKKHSPRRLVELHSRPSLSTSSFVILGQLLHLCVSWSFHLLNGNSFYLESSKDQRAQGM